MNLSNDEREKIQPKRKEYDLLHLLSLAIVGLQVLIAVVAFPFLPPIVPIHWDALGHPDGYASRWNPTILFPLIALGVYLLMRFMLTLGPRLGGRAQVAANAQTRMTLLVALLLFNLVLQLLTTTVSLGMAVDFAFTMNLALSLLFIVIGNYLGKTRRNFWMGIRTPWTLSSDVTWERTHRLGGWLFVAVGLLGIPASFIPPLRPWALIVLILLVCLFLSGYSYWCYRQNTTEEREPLSPPFDEEHDGGF